VIPATLDGFLLAYAVQERATCRRGSGPHATCSALYAGGSRLDTADRYFNYTVAVSSTAGGLRGALHDAHWSALYV
jgi:hypothetical protein